MKDYSKYFANPQSYITDCKIEKKRNGEPSINITYAGGKRGYIYNPEKKDIDFFNQKIKDQYQVVIENSKTILKDKKTILPFIAFIIMLGSLILTYTIVDLIFLYLAGGAFITWISGIIYNKKVTKELTKDLVIYKAFMENADEVLSQIKKDSQNIIRHVSKKTIHNIQEDMSLSEEGYIESSELSTIFMDKTKLKDLKEMLIATDVARGLDEEVAYVEPKVKKRQK